MSDHERRGFLDILGADARRVLLARARTMRVRKGQTVLSRGERPGDVFIVQEGRLQVVLYAANGREVSLRDLSAGQLFGELSAIDDEVRSVAIVAASDARLMAIPNAAFRASIADYPEVSEWLLHRLVSQVRELTDRVFELSALSVQARLHCELVRMARDPSYPALTHAELANRIGTHREAVTRELKSLSDQNIVRSSRRRIEFLDPDRLEEVVRASLRMPLASPGWW